MEASGVAGRPDALSQRTPRVGVTQWRNPRNDLVVVELHYSADPRKRSPEWKAATARNLHPRTWRREYEIDWTASEGEPVVPEYVEGKHCREFTWDPSLRLLRFWDFGFVSPVCLFAQLTTWGQLRVRRELCPFNTPLNQLLPAVQAVTIELGGLDFALGQADPYDVGGAAPEEIEEINPQRTRKVVFDAGDPAGENQTDLGSSADYLSAKGVILHTTRPGTEVSYANLRARFLRDVMEPGVGPQPAVLVHPECPALREALNGGFHLASTQPRRIVKSHPAKDLVDALRYGEDNLSSLSRGHDDKMRQMALEDVRELRGVESLQRPPERTFGGEFFRP